MRASFAVIIVTSVSGTVVFIVELVGRLLTGSVYFPQSKNIHTNQYVINIHLLNFIRTEHAIHIVKHIQKEQ